MTRSTPKPTTSESSVTSLGELMRLEKERQDEEENLRLREHQAKLRADEDAAKRLLAAEEEARTKVAAEVRLREQEAAVLAGRIDAETRATVERQKVLALEAAREAERQRERDHELSVKRLELQAAAERSPTSTLVGYGVAVVVLVAAVLVQVLVLGPNSDAKLAQVSEIAKQNGVALDTLRSERDGQKRRADGLTKDLAESHQRLTALETELAQLKAARAPKAGPLGPTPAPGPRNPSADQPCQKGDPLCPTIGKP